MPHNKRPRVVVGLTAVVPAAIDAAVAGVDIRGGVGGDGI